MKRRLLIIANCFFILLLLTIATSVTYAEDESSIKGTYYVYYDAEDPDYLDLNIGDSFLISLDEDKIKVMREDGNIVSQEERNTVLSKLDFNWYFIHKDDSRSSEISLGYELEFTEEDKIQSKTPYSVFIDSISENDLGEYCFRITERSTGLVMHDSWTSLYINEFDPVYYVSMNEGSCHQFPETGDCYAYFYNTEDDMDFDESSWDFRIAEGARLKLDGVKDIKYRINIFHKGIADNSKLDLMFEWYDGSTNKLISTGKVFDLGKIPKGYNKSFILKVYLKGYNGEYQTIKTRPFTVKSVKPTIKLNAKSTLPIQIKKTCKLKATVKPGDSVKSWKSSKPKVVSVSKTGKIKAKKVGKATITVKTKLGAVVKLKVKVQKGKVKTTGFIVTLPYLVTNDTGYIKVKRLPITANANEKIKYSSSNTSVVKINKKGKLTTKKLGSATITIRAGKAVKKVKFTTHDD